MPRDAVSRTANVEHTVRHKQVKLTAITGQFFYLIYSVEAVGQLSLFFCHWTKKQIDKKKFECLNQNLQYNIFVQHPTAPERTPQYEAIENDEEEERLIQEDKMKKEELERGASKDREWCNFYGSRIFRRGTVRLKKKT